MGDDFDLFPKRENLDPFAFGKKEKQNDKEQADTGDELFGQDEQPQGQPPDFPIEMPADPSLEPSPPLPDLPLEGPEVSPPLPDTGIPPVEPPPLDQPPEPSQEADVMDPVAPGGPISEEKTFDEPVFEQPEAPVIMAGNPKKSPSPFIIISGSLVIIIGLLYGALTYLKRDKTEPPATPLPQATAPVTVTEPETVPPPGPTEHETAAPETAVPEITAAPDETQSSPGPAPSAVEETPAPEPAVEAVPETTAAVETASAPEPVSAVPDGSSQYSVQVGAFILDSSVKALERKLREAGYDPILKKGSTTAMMNMLTAGPFKSMEEAKTALSRLKSAGVDSNVRGRSDGTAIINAGSYLLEENATSVMKKIRSLGYPVRMSKKEAQLPMTFIRIGQYAGMEEAIASKTELAEKGLDGIVVKLQ